MFFSIKIKRRQKYFYWISFKLKGRILWNTLICVIFEHLHILTYGPNEKTFYGQLISHPKIRDETPGLFTLLPQNRQKKLYLMGQNFLLNKTEFIHRKILFSVKILPNSIGLSGRRIPFWTKISRLARMEIFRSSADWRQKITHKYVCNLFFLRKYTTHI